MLSGSCVTACPARTMCDCSIARPDLLSRYQRGRGRLTRREGEERVRAKAMRVKSCIPAFCRADNSPLTFCEVARRECKT